MMSWAQRHEASNRYSEDRLVLPRAARCSRRNAATSCGDCYSAREEEEEEGEWTGCQRGRNVASKRRRLDSETHMELARSFGPYPLHARGGELFAHDRVAEDFDEGL